MFEQSLYDVDPIAPPLAEGDLFHNYEIRNWDFGPRIYRIVAIAGVGNILALLIVAQTSLLTLKGCDSPLVSTVCQAIDTLVVGTTIFGTEREYVDAVYEKTDLGDVDVTFVDVSGQEPQFQYPVDYFKIANPEQEQASVAQFADNDPFGLNSVPFPTGVPITPPSRGGGLLNTTPKLPKANNDVIDGTLPDAIGSGDTKPAKPGKAKPTPSPDTTAKTDEPKVDPTAPVTDVELNKRPFTDLGNTVNDLLAKRQVNLETPFLIKASGKLDKNGRLDPKSFKITQAESPDPRMLEVIKEAIQAMDASGYLQYLSMVNVKDISFIIQQDSDNVTAFVESQFDNDLRPRTISTLLTGYINTKKEAKAAPDASQNDKDDLVLLQNAAVTPNGKKLVISFSIPKAEVQRMIQRKLAEQKAEPKQPNSNTSGGLANNTAIK